MTKWSQFKQLGPQRDSNEENPIKINRYNKQREKQRPILHHCHKIISKFKVEDAGIQKNNRQTWRRSKCSIHLGSLWNRPKRSLPCGIVEAGRWRAYRYLSEGGRGVEEHGMPPGRQRACEWEDRSSVPLGLSVDSDALVVYELVRMIICLTQHRGRQMRRSPHRQMKQGFGHSEFHVQLPLDAFLFLCTKQEKKKTKWSSLLI